MKNNAKWLMAIILSVVIITAGTMIFIKIRKNHQANQLIIEECFENMKETETVVVVKGSIWSPVSCTYK